MHPVLILLGLGVLWTAWGSVIAALRADAAGLPLKLSRAFERAILVTLAVVTLAALTFLWRDLGLGPSGADQIGL